MCAVSRILPLLLCLTLLASAVGSVWMATTMAIPMSVATMPAAAHDCHDMPAAMVDGARMGHASPASPCADGQHCDCTQHCNVMPASLLLVQAEIPRAQPLPASAAGRESVAPARLNRPPIA